MSLRIYNTLTRTKEDFAPRDEGRVGIYVCGVTPYSGTHIGHARPAVVWDVIRRYFEYKGYQTFVVQNFTDVDDKIIARAQERGLDPIKMAESHIHDYLEEMDALGVKPPHASPRATHHIDDMIQMIERLMELGTAYAADGDVYFDISRFPGYGKLSNRRACELLSDEDSGYRARKRNPGDFALWKGAKPGEPSWDSPWGRGRPGWHIECSAMSLRLLGPGFDLHGGGTDLIFPHHENEIAQSEAYLQEPFVRYWLHHGMIRTDGEKMSKSLGNVVDLRAILDKFPGQVVRYYLLSAHYRKPLNFDWSLLDEAGRALGRWQNALRALTHLADRQGGEQIGDGESLVTAADESLGAFLAAMDDDFNTPRAMAAGFDLIRAVNEFASSGVDDPARAGVALQVLSTMATILGIEPAPQTADASIIGELVDALLEIRQELRNKKDWIGADRVRDRLAGVGIVLEDTPKGTRWKWDGEGGARE